MRCDLNIDCADSSDEMNCTFLEKPSWYLTDVSPPKNKGSQVSNLINLRLLFLQGERDQREHHPVQHTSC